MLERCSGRAGARRSRVLGGLLLALVAAPACDQLPPGGLVGPGTLDEAEFAPRRQAFLEHATGALATGSPLSAIAHMERELRDPGYQAPEGAFGADAWDAIFTKISTFEDTSDFDVLYLINALLGYRDHPRAVVVPELWQKTEDAILAFKFWYTQPTPPGIVDDMWYWSENHQIIFHTLEYLAGQTWPDRTFTTTGMTGEEHRAHARERILWWLDHKARFGFDEWHSNVYYQKDVTPLLTLVEHADEPEIATRAAMLLDRVLLDLALHNFRGAFAATRGRTYKKDKMTSLHDDTYGLQKLLFDESPYPYESRTDAGAVLFARAKKYALPKLIENAGRSETPFVDRERMGIPIDEFAELPRDEDGNVVIDETGAIPPPPAPYGFDYRDEANLPIYWAMSALTTWPVLPMVFEVADKYSLWDSELFQPYVEIRDAVGSLAFAQIAAQALPHAASSPLNEEVNTYTYRTADYLMSTAQDHRKGSRGNQYHSWQATFDPNALVFTTHPGTAPRQTLDWSDDGEPGSWTGTASQPRSAQHENVGIHLYAPQYTVAPGVFRPLTRYEPYTHAYFPQDHFDEVVRDGHWTFGRFGDGYIALYSWRLAEFVDHGPNVATNGMLQPFDLVAPGGPDNVWIVELGSLSESGSFAAFQVAVRNAAVSVTPVTTDIPRGSRGPFFEVRYESPSQGALEFSWTGPFLVDGAPVALTDYPRMDNPWTRIEHLDLDLTAQDPETGAALYHRFEKGQRVVFDVR
ncbi:MAG: hypothetical protein DCC71_00635 [Proteobacteria bacterium]|nr:MAG: hypothetical protein DCC71_00635 [Pseudomonadota bacterium]